VVPLAFVAYLPCLYILERPDPLGLPPPLQVSSPLVAAVFLLAARGCWALGVRHYQGTGS
jgi:ABC-2 type transport system permease protein